MATWKLGATATPLTNGTILVAGGFGGVTAYWPDTGVALSDAGLYNPSTGTALGILKNSHSAALQDAAPDVIIDSVGEHEAKLAATASRCLRSVRNGRYRRAQRGAALAARRAAAGPGQRAALAARATRWIV
jgi:hypothetical protein